MNASSVTVSFRTNVSGIDPALWGACFATPLEGRFWYDTLEGCGLEDQFTFLYAVIERDGVVVGFAPCFVHDVPISLVAPAPVAAVLGVLSRVYRRVGYQRTLFVGSPCSDEGTIGLLPGVALADVIVPLGRALRAKALELSAPMVVFKDFPDEALAGLRRLVAAENFFVMASYPGTVVALTAPDKAAYIRSLGHTQRHNFQKKLRRSSELIELSTNVLMRPSDAELAEIFGLFMQTFERGKTKFERLDIRFFQQVREKPEARFVVQRDAKTGEMVTFMLVFHLGTRVINKFIGIDYARAGKTFLYFRLFDAALDYAYSVGATEIQSGQTGYRAKFDLGHRLVPLHNVVRHRNPLIHALFRAIGTRVTWRSLDPDLATYLEAREKKGDGKKREVGGEQRE